MSRVMASVSISMKRSSDALSNQALMRLPIAGEAFCMEGIGGFAGLPAPARLEQRSGLPNLSLTKVLPVGVDKEYATLRPTFLDVPRNKDATQPWNLAPAATI